MEEAMRKEGDDQLQHNANSADADQCSDEDGDDSLRTYFSYDMRLSASFNFDSGIASSRNAVSKAAQSAHSFPNVNKNCDYTGDEPTCRYTDCDLHCRSYCSPFVLLSFRIRHGSNPKRVWF